MLITPAAGCWVNYLRIFFSSDAPTNGLEEEAKEAQRKKEVGEGPNYHHQLARWIMESMEYEQARNLTLLFFFERLIDKNEPRTLHDLSCQFGAPGFTKEMRQIAGGSESGES